MSKEIDLGHDHFLRFLMWAPDDLPQNRELYDVPDGQPMPRVERAGAIVRHRLGDGWCEAAINFDLLPALPIRGGGPRWTVESWDPLTLAPSLLCRCGDHGLIREGRWVPA